MLGLGTVIDIGDHTVEVLSNPATAIDRYRLRIEADPGGPGIKGDFPHLHPALIETFKCVSGDMIIRSGRTIDHLQPGESVAVEAGVVHGFLNAGDGPLIVESEVIFPQGYRAEDDLMLFAATYDRLRRERRVSRRGGEPPLLQMAALTQGYRHVIRQPGIAGLLMPALAGLGRLVGYRARPFADPPAGKALP